MKIQVISTKKKETKEEKGYGIVFSEINNPRTFDAFDINIIDLQNDNIWQNEQSSYDRVDHTDDFVTLQELIERSNKSKTIICFPKNYIYCSHYMCDRYFNKVYLKDMIPDMITIVSTLIPSDTLSADDLFFERSVTLCDGAKYESYFSFQFSPEYYTELTLNNGAENPTTIKVSEKLILTTLDLTDSQNGLGPFLRTIGYDNGQKTEVPDWAKQLYFFNDQDQEKKIKESEEQIENAKNAIEKARDALTQNLFFKRILFETGNPLVESVFKMLEKMIQCDLSSFQDEKREDFRIVLPDVTFIGEIKGINTNVKSSNVAQLETHCAEYSDELDAEGKTENIKGLLIINTERTKNVSEREAIPQKQLNSAVRNKSLLIKTEVFLRLFELFLLGKISSEQVVQLFKDKIGALELTDYIQ